MTISHALESETHESVAAAKEHARGWSMALLMERYEALYADARLRFQGAK